jgi:hypothetical protein
MRSMTAFTPPWDPPGSGSLTPLSRKMEILVLLPNTIVGVILLPIVHGPVEQRVL